MSRRPALAPRWLKALAAWEDGDAEPMIAAMKAGFPKTEDEVMIFASFARRVGNFKRKRGRHGSTPSFSPPGFTTSSGATE